MRMKALVTNAENFLRVNKELSEDIDAYTKRFKTVADPYYGYHIAYKLVKILVDKIKEEADGSMD